MSSRIKVEVIFVYFQPLRERLVPMRIGCDLVDPLWNDLMKSGLLSGQDPNLVRPMGDIVECVLMQAYTHG
jgi:hypothetical protein